LHAAIPHEARIGLYMPAWVGGRDLSGTRELVTATAAALILSFFLSWGAVYGLNRYFGPDDAAEMTGAMRPSHPFD